jgi:hypothetical protein
MERMAQRFKLWPDFLTLMAGRRRKPDPMPMPPPMATDP